MDADLFPVNIRPARLADAAALSTFPVRIFAETFGPYTAPDDLAAYFALGNRYIAARGNRKSHNVPKWHEGPSIMLIDSTYRFISMYGN